MFKQPEATPSIRGPRAVIAGETRARRAGAGRARAAAFGLGLAGTLALLGLAPGVVAAPSREAKADSAEKGPATPPPVEGLSSGAMSEMHVDREVGTARGFNLEVGQNRLLILSEAITRVSVANPDVADLKVITPTQLLVTAHGVGTTDLTLWNKKDQPLVMSLVVTRNLDALRRQLAELFPGEKLTVTPAGGDLVVLSGEVTDVRIPDRAAEVAKLHAEKVANLIRVTGTQQVQLEVRFAEVSRRGLREMGFNFFHQDSSNRFVAGATNSGTDPGSVLAIPGTGVDGRPSIYPRSPGGGFSIFFSGLPRFPLSGMLSLLESSGLAKMLAEPTLVAMSGQEAKFLAGGEFPIPYSTGLGAVTVQWKKFGIMLAFTPTVVSDGMLNLHLSTEVSDVDPTRAVQVNGFNIPGVTSRQSDTTVRLSDGQSFAIAGLLSSRMRSQIDKIPFLGDLPILGALFRSIEYSRDESELLVVVTAHLARPMAPHEVPHLPTEDELNDPNDFALFLLGSEGTGPPDAEKGGGHAGKSKHRGPTGELGFIR
jgi:pilus assembly protein CpaC